MRISASVERETESSALPQFETPAFCVGTDDRISSVGQSYMVNESSAESGAAGEMSLHLMSEKSKESQNIMHASRASFNNNLASDVQDQDIRGCR